jgi:plasmid stabilization system protein ParE
VTPPNLSRQVLRDNEQAVDDMIEAGAGPAYAERFAMAAAETAETIARRPLLGHRRLELLPARFRFWAIRGFDYQLVYNAEHPE